MDATSLLQQLFFTTVYINARDASASWTATGFVYAVETTAGTVHFLVTNKHVFQNATSLKVRMIRRTSGGGPALGKAAEIEITEFGPAVWRGHPDPAVDVAVLPFAVVLLMMQTAEGLPFFKAFEPVVSLTEDVAADLDAIEEVTFVGYPSGIFDSHSLLPVARRGITATPIEVDYGGQPAFLIDASVFPGSSGSPVLIANWGSYVTKAATTVIGSRLVLLGVLAAVHVHQVQGQVQQLPAAHVVHVEEAVDLGIVYKATAIQACVDIILQEHGMTRIEAEPTEPNQLSSADEAIDERLDKGP